MSERFLLKKKATYLRRVAGIAEGIGIFLTGAVFITALFLDNKTLVVVSSAWTLYLAAVLLICRSDKLKNAVLTVLCVVLYTLALILRTPFVFLAYGVKGVATYCADKLKRHLRVLSAK